jgi:carboxyl-terminal processing protease
MIVPKRSSPLLALGAVLLLFTACGTRALGQMKPKQVEAKIDTVVKRMRSRDLDSIWVDVTELRMLPRSAGRSLLDRAEKEKGLVRMALARAACSLGLDTEGGLMLVNIAKTSRDAKTRRYAAGSLGLIPGLYKNPRIVEQLDGILETERDALTRVSICRTLWRLTRDAEYVTRLERLTRHADPRVANEAALTLAENGKLPLVRSHLLRIFSDPTPQGERALMLLRNHKGVKQDAESALRLLGEIFMTVRDRYVDEDKSKDFNAMASSAASAILENLDPFSGYLDEDAMKAMRVAIGGEYGGIGAYVGMRNKVFTIIAPIYGGPAYKVGLKSLDQVIAVDGEKTRSIKFEGVITKLKGKPGTPVRVKVYRRGWTVPKEFTIIRDKIKVKSVFSQMLPGKIGYVRLIRFGRMTSTDLEKALRKFEAQGMRGLVLDLRDNHGGLLRSSVEISDMFIEGGKMIVYSKGRGDQRKNFRSRDFTTHPKMPMTVLINSGSASASEIVSGALQDHRRATLIGQTSYGKGSVQEVMPLDATLGKTALRLTVAKYYLPSDRSIHGTGVAPDIVLASDALPGWQVGLILDLREDRKVQLYVERLWNESLDDIVTTMAGDNEDLASDLQDLNGFAFRPFMTKDPNPKTGTAAQERHVRLRDYGRRLKSDPALVRRILAQAQKDGFKPAGGTDILDQLPAIRAHYLGPYARAAETDKKKTTDYPDFEAFYASLKIDAPDSFKKAIRGEIRRGIRQRIADERGQEFVTDVQEDAQLQRAIHELAKKVPFALKDLELYKPFADRFKEKEEAAALK